MAGEGGVASVCTHGIVRLTVLSPSEKHVAVKKPRLHELPHMLPHTSTSPMLHSGFVGLSKSSEISVVTFCSTLIALSVIALI